MATRACGGTVAYPKRGLFLPHISNMYSLDDIKLVPNLATRGCGGTLVYPGGLLGKFQGEFAFYSISLTCIVSKILWAFKMTYFDLGVTLGWPLKVKSPKNMFWYVPIAPRINAHYFYANAQSVNKMETNRQTNLLTIGYDIELPPHLPPFNKIKTAAKTLIYLHEEYLKPHGTYLEPQRHTRNHIGHNWNHMGHTWEHMGRTWGHMGHTWNHMGHTWIHMINTCNHLIHTCVISWIFYLWFPSIFYIS